MNLMEFKTYIEKKYVEWTAAQGKRKSIADYAAYLGISQPLLSMWMNGSKKPGAQNIKLLHEIYGDEVLSALGNDVDLYFVQTHWDRVPEKAKKIIREQVSKYITKENSNT